MPSIPKDYYRLAVMNEVEGPFHKVGGKPVLISGESAVRRFAAIDQIGGVENFYNHLPKARRKT